MVQETEREATCHCTQVFCSPRSIQGHGLVLVSRSLSTGHREGPGAQWCGVRQLLHTSPRSWTKHRSWTVTERIPRLGAEVIFSRAAGPKLTQMLAELLGPYAGFERCRPRTQHSGWLRQRELKIQLSLGNLVTQQDAVGLGLGIAQC